MMARQARRNFGTSRSIRQINRILGALNPENDGKPMTARQLSARLHLCQSVVFDYAWHLSNTEPRRVHVCGKVAGRQGRHSPVYAFGAKGVENASID